MQAASTTARKIDERFSLFNASIVVIGVFRRGPCLLCDASAQETVARCIARFSNHMRLHVIASLFYNHATFFRRPRTTIVTFSATVQNSLRKLLQSIDHAVIQGMHVCSSLGISRNFAVLLRSWHSCAAHQNLFAQQKSVRHPLNGGCACKVFFTFCIHCKEVMQRPRCLVAL